MNNNSVPGNLCSSEWKTEQGIVYTAFRLDT